VPTPRLRDGGLAALRLLEMCPLMPVDAFVPLLACTHGRPGISNSHGCGGRIGGRMAE